MKKLVDLLITLIVVLSVTTIKQLVNAEDCAQAPCTLPNMTITSAPPAPPTLAVECPKYVVLNGVRLEFTDLDRSPVDNGDRELPDCIYMNQDTGVYVSIEAKRHQ